MTSVCVRFLRNRACLCNNALDHGNLGYTERMKERERQSTTTVLKFLAGGGQVERCDREDISPHCNQSSPRSREHPLSRKRHKKMRSHRLSGPSDDESVPVMRYFRFFTQCGYKVCGIT